MAWASITGIVIVHEERSFLATSRFSRMCVLVQLMFNCSCGRTTSSFPSSLLLWLLYSWLVSSSLALVIAQFLLQNFPSRKAWGWVRVGGRMVVTLSELFSGPDPGHKQMKKFKFEICSPEWMFVPFFQISNIKKKCLNFPRKDLSQRHLCPHRY